MSKTFKILILILVIIAIGVTIFFVYQYYHDKKTQTEEEANITDEYNQYLQETTVLGTVKEIADDKIVVLKDNGQEAEYKISGDVKYEKLGEINENQVAKFVETKKEDVKKDQTVWLFFEGDNPNEVSLIKITEVNPAILPTPTDAPVK